MHQKWCDCDLDSGHQNCQQSRLSIPQWCDCDFNEYEIAKHFDKTFNPTMVRLRQVSMDVRGSNVDFFQSHNGAIATGFRGGYSWKPTDTFQSHNGAIATVTTFFCAAIASNLSIPQWCDCDR